MRQIDPYIAAAVQWTPCVHDPVAGAKKAAEAIAEAAGMGAKLVVFPETWLQGYPYFSGLAAMEPEFQAYLQTFWNAAIAVPGPVLKPVQDAAKRHKVVVVMSANEKGGSTVYNAQIFIGSDWRILGKHRKLMPTLQERLVWGMGDGSDLDAHDTDCGILSGLLCFEHQMAPVRFALNGLGVQVHASAWPGHGFLHHLVDAATRQLAFENGCFVIVAREVMAQDRIMPGMPPSTCHPGQYAMSGGSAIIGPDGRYLVEPVFDKEVIITAEIDLGMIVRSKIWCDGVGHYARPDVFQLKWDKRPKLPIEITE
jgi:nitrilase